METREQESDLCNGQKDRSSAKMNSNIALSANPPITRLNAEICSQPRLFSHRSCSIKS